MDQPTRRGAENEQPPDKKNEMVQINIYDMDVGLQHTDKKMVFFENEHGRYIRDHDQERIEQVLEKKKGTNINMDDDVNLQLHHPRAEELRNREMVNSMRQEQKDIERYLADKSAPQGPRTQKNFEKGANGDTIEMDDRFVDQKDYQTMKKGQRVGADNQYADALYKENQQDDDSDRLAVKKEPIESLFG